MVVSTRKLIVTVLLVFRVGAVGFLFGAVTRKGERWMDYFALRTPPFGRDPCFLFALSVVFSCLPLLRERRTLFFPTGFWLLFFACLLACFTNVGRRVRAL